MLKSADENIQDSKIPPVTEKQWINHFTTLHSKKVNTVEQDRIVNVPEQSEIYNQILDSPITENEIKANAKKLKNKKSIFHR